MLSSLHIENVAVIRSLDVDLTDGLCVITGETGAGKSVMLDALGFLLGGRAARDLLRNGASQCEVSALFTDLGERVAEHLQELGVHEQDEILLQRSLTADGKSKCRLNGRAVPLSLLRALLPVRP